MESYYNLNYSKEQISSILEIIQNCIKMDRFIISMNEFRQENVDFVNNYNLTHKIRKKILLKIKIEDFCHSVKNLKLGFEHEELFVFCPQVMLFDFDGEEELVDIYTKFNIIDYAGGKRIITISFHKRNKPIDYLFR